MRRQFLLCALWALQTLAYSAAEDKSKPCTFPERCACLIDGWFLKCTAMERCLSEEGMDEIATSLQFCPTIDALTISCSQVKVEPTAEITPQLFRHQQWRRLKRLVIGSGCTFMFQRPHVLSQLPSLQMMSFTNTHLSMDLTRFSEVICCPQNLSELIFSNVLDKSGHTRFGRTSFTGYRALAKLTIFFSSSLVDRIDLVLNTSAPLFQFFWKGNLQPESRNFSSLAIRNLANTTTLHLGLSNCKVKFNLDAPASIVGIKLSTLALQNMRLGDINNQTFRDFSLKQLTVTGSALNDKQLSNLLSAIEQIRNRPRLQNLALEFKLTKQVFPFDEFNSLCASLPTLHSLSISHSTISFADPKKHFNCSQLLHLSLPNCDLTNDKLPPHSFRGLTQLINLGLTNNRLYTFPTDVLRNTPRLEYLDISVNPKMELHPSSLRGILPKLTKLKLSEASFSKPLTDAFLGQPNLTELKLIKLRPIGSAKRCAFRQTWFRNCSTLRKLNLVANSFFGSFECHTVGFFDPLVNLEELDLSSCTFGKQTDGIVKSLLTKLVSLKFLSLRDNAVGRLEFFIRNQMPNLTVLDASNNPFSSIPKDLFLSNTPQLKVLYLMRNPIVNIDPETFSHMPNIRIKLGRNQFACTCDLLPFSDWLRQQWPIYKAEDKGDWLNDGVCYTRSNQTVRLLDFRMSWWDCYSRRLIVSLAASVGALLVISGTAGLLVQFRWKLQYSVLAFCIRHGLVRRRVPTAWAYDGCFIYDETDSSVSQWVASLILKLETDLQLRLYEPERDAPAGANILDEAASAIDKSRHAVLVLSRGFLENRLSMYSAQWSNESLFLRRRSLAVLVMRERLSESDLQVPGCKVLHRLYRMCKPARIVDCSGCGVDGNSANRLGLLLYKGSGGKAESPGDVAETEPLISD